MTVRELIEVFDTVSFKLVKRAKDYREFELEQINGYDYLNLPSDVCYIDSYYSIEYDEEDNGTVTDYDVIMTYDEAMNSQVKAIQQETTELFIII